MAVASDAASQTAARRLAAGAGWAAEGASEQAVWGSCSGSGKVPYQVVVELAGPAYTCTCPSRKFPCKHALALLLRWSAGSVPDGEPPSFATSWLQSRRRREQGAATRGQASKGGKVLAEPDSAAKRAAQRATRVAGGLTELDRWLADQVRNGLTGLQSGGYSALDQMASRLVDAQAPGLARWVRSLAGVLASGPSWPAAMVEELALMRLLISAHRDLAHWEATDPDFAATVRSHVGYPMAKEDVLARPPVTDIWDVLAVRDEELENLRSRTVWLWGRDSDRAAVVLSFAAAGSVLDGSLTPGTAFHGGLHFYPGAGQLRAVVDQSRQPVGFRQPVPRRTEDALDRVARALAQDPWTRSVPVIIAAAPVPRPGTSDRPRWDLLTAENQLVPLHPSAGQPWGLAAESGGAAVTQLVEWTPGGWRTLAFWGVPAVVAS